jgi:hypothetical protein
MPCANSGIKSLHVSRPNHSRHAVYAEIQTKAAGRSAGMTMYDNMWSAGRTLSPRLSNYTFPKSNFEGCPPIVIELNMQEPHLRNRGLVASGGDSGVRARQISKSYQFMANIRRGTAEYSFHALVQPLMRFAYIRPGGEGHQVPNPSPRGMAFI